MGNSFAVILLIGPGEQEIERAKDTIESLNAYEPGRFRLFLVDDAPIGPHLPELVAPKIKNEIVYLKNPRNRKGSGWGAGAAAGVLHALRRVVEMGPVDFVLKIDTDTLVIGPFSERIFSFFSDSPMAGILGVYQFSPQRLADRTSTPALEKLLRQITVWRRTPAGGPALQVAFWGKYGRIRNIIRRALLNGYRLGEHCSGGAYAVSPNCLHALNEAGLLAEPTLWLQTPLGEDQVAALSAASVEFGIGTFDPEHEVFAVRHLGLPYPPEELVKRGYSIIHSVKDYEGQREVDIRAYFRKRREYAGRNN
jgi:hypothetical protein